MSKDNNVFTDEEIKKYSLPIYKFYKGIYSYGKLKEEMESIKGVKYIIPGQCNYQVCENDVEGLLSRKEYGTYKPEDIDFFIIRNDRIKAPFNEYDRYLRIMANTGYLDFTKEYVTRQHDKFSFIKEEILSSKVKEVLDMGISPYTDNLTKAYMEELLRSFDINGLSKKKEEFDHLVKVLDKSYNHISFDTKKCK